MKIALDIESSRVKGLSFHPKRPWILVSLHNGNIELYDYQHSRRLAVYAEHSGPVRAVDFHPAKTLFVSGGDDHRIKVWDFAAQSRLFELLGHSDYVRTVKFHAEKPWLISASDDQTARLWNWQSRVCVAVLSGHNHYVMCAQFHPREDLIVTASLDETVRVWDISAIGSTISTRSRVPFSNGSRDLFNNSGAHLKFLLEGHCRGVNWAVFHPREPLIVSAADDRDFKVWRFNETHFWETDSVSEHNENVSCAIFDPNSAKCVVSASEDTSLAVWDGSLGAVVQRYAREGQRFWALAAHPTNGLFAAGHDGGFFLFRTKAVFPAVCRLENSIFFALENSLVKYDFCEKAMDELKLASGALGSPAGVIAMDAGNFLETCFILIYKTGKTKNYKILDPQKSLSEETYSCIDICSFTRNRFVVLEERAKRTASKRADELTLVLKNERNVSKKVVLLPVEGVKKLFAANGNKIGFVSDTKAGLFDVMKGKILAEIQLDKSLSSPRNAIWTKDASICALFFDKRVSFLDPNLKKLGELSESAKISSGVWDEDSGTLIYTCGYAIKYSLLNGENGLLLTEKTRLKLLKVTPEGIVAMKNNAELVKLPLDSSEFQFKKAVEMNDTKEVSRLIAQNTFFGQKIVSFLVRKNFLEAALRFGQDDSLRFQMALSCGNMEFARECAEKLDSKEAWETLAGKAFSLGNFKEAEMGLIRAKNLEALILIYFLSGQRDNMVKLQQCFVKTDNKNGILQTSLYLGDYKQLSNLCHKSGFESLAFIAASKTGLKNTESLRQSLPPDILSRCLKHTPNNTKPLQTIQPASKSLQNWPKQRIEKQNVDKRMERLLQSFDQKKTFKRQPNPPKTPINKTQTAQKSPDFNEWMTGLETLVEPTQPAPPSNSPARSAAPGQSVEETWLRGSPQIYDLAAAKEFALAAERLRRKFGIAAFEPLKPLFSQIAQCAFVRVSTVPFASSLRVALRDTPQNRPNALGTFTVALCRKKVEAALEKVTARRFCEALAEFETLIRVLPFVRHETRKDIQLLNGLLKMSREYILALKCNKKREAEPNEENAMKLACYWTLLTLNPLHTFLGLMIAIHTGQKLGFRRDVAILCRRCLEIGMALRLPQSMGKAVESVSQILRQSEEQLKGAGKRPKRLGLDLRGKIALDGFTLRPVKGEDHRVFCGYCGTFYEKATAFSRGKTAYCATCKIGAIGAEVYEGFY